MKTQIIFTCARCGKEQIENLNYFTVRRFKYRNLIGKDTKGYKLDKEICPDCYRSLKIWLNNGDEYKEIIDENDILKKQKDYLNEQRNTLQTQLEEVKEELVGYKDNEGKKHYFKDEWRRLNERSYRCTISESITVCYC